MIQRSFHRYLLSGCAIFGLGFIQYHLLYFVVSGTRSPASYAWVLNFFVGTIWIHAIHWRFTFRQRKRDGYFQSLARTYLSYLLSHLIGMLLIFVVCDKMRYNHSVGFIIANTVSSVFAYSLLRHFSIGPATSAYEYK